MMLLVSCASAQTEVPAVIEQPSVESRAELARAVSGALNGAPVTLADDALTRDSLLTIERAHRPTGRDLGGPERFRLLKAGASCVLLHEGTATRTPLASTRCRPGD